MADRSRNSEQERVVHNWRLVVMSAITRPPSRPGHLGSYLPESIPASVSQASNINTILHVADEIQHEAPNVSHICHSRNSKQERVLHNWRLVVMFAISRSTSHPDRLGFDLLDSVPASLSQASNINTILEVADEIQHEDSNVSRILCEYAYSLSQSLDPNSEGRGVVQLRTGLITVIRAKLARKEGTFDRSQDIEKLGKFYKDYRKKHHFDDMRGDADVESQFQDGQLRSRDFTVLRVLRDVVYSHAGDKNIDPDTIITPKAEEL